MKILAILGSPKKHGNAAMLLQEYLKPIINAGKASQVDIVHLHEKTINFCTGCCACKTGKINNCILNDDMQLIYPKIENANLIIIATPIYFYGPTAQTKVFMDRLYAVDEKHWQGKKYTTITTFGDKNEIVSGAVNWENIFAHFLSDYEGELIHSYKLSTGSVKTHKPYLEQKIAEEIYNLGVELLTLDNEN